MKKTKTTRAKFTCGFMVVLALMLQFSCNGQKSYTQNFISKSGLEKDLNILKHQLEKVHAGLYEYSSKATLHSAFLAIHQNINDSLTDIEFYRLLAPIQSIIKNGHTMVIPSESWSNHKMESLPLFPFEIYWTNERLYILKNLSHDSTLIDGTEIISINGVPSSQVVEKLVNNITRDGNNRTYPLFLMGQGFEHWYADIIGTPEYFDLELRHKHAHQPFKRKIEALHDAEIKAKHFERYGAERTAWFLRPQTEKLNLKINRETAILRVPSFDSGLKSEKGEKYSRFYKRAFAEIKSHDVNHLILDLRNNTGGDPKPQLALLNHLWEESSQIDNLYKQTYAIMEKVPNVEYYPNDNVKKLNRLAGLILRKRGDKFEVSNNIFSRLQGTPPKKQKKMKNWYDGKLYVLINGGSFSATGECAGMIKNRNRAIFIGEEAGGSDWQNTSGRMIMLHLPHSGVRLRMPLIVSKLNVSGSNDGHGVIPDYLIRNSIEDTISGRDAVLERTKMLIVESKK